MRQKKEINIQIGEQIRIARERAKLTQEQLAERIDVSPQYISDLERGVVGISIPTLKRTCIVLGVTSDKVLFGTTSDARAKTIERKCENLTDAEFMALMEITDVFTAAIKSVLSDKKQSSSDS